MLLMKHLEHFRFLNLEYSGRPNRASRPHAYGLSSQRTFPKEVPRFQNGDDCLFADFINDRELHTACSYVHYALSSITLRVDNLRFFKFFNLSCNSSGIEKNLGIEDGSLRG